MGVLIKLRFATFEISPGKKTIMYKAEIIAIGDELLRGDVANTTTPFIIDQIREIGYCLVRTTTIGDEIDRIAGAVQDALRVVDITIITGGLGPDHRRRHQGCFIQSN